MDSSLFPALFWPLALAHALALLSPGPDFVLIVSHSIRNGLKGAAFICIGIALGNAVYIALAIAGWAGLSRQPVLYGMLQLAGAVYLAWLGICLIRTAKKTFAEQEAVPDATPLPFPSQLAIGFGSAILNPKNMVFYLSIMNVLITTDTPLRQRIAAGVWMCGLVLSWDLLLAGAMSCPRARFFSARFIPGIETACGLVLLIFSASMLVLLWA